MDRTQAWSFRSLLTKRRQSPSRAPRKPWSRLSLSIPAGSLWASVIRAGGKCKPELPWGSILGTTSRTENPLPNCTTVCPMVSQLHLLAGCHAREQPDIHVPVPWQRNQTTKEKTQGHTPGPDWGPVFLQQETEKQPVTQGTGSPYIWPEGLRCWVPSAPVPSRWPASGCPELAFPNPVWKMLFI